MNNKNYPNLKSWKKGQSGNPAGRKQGSKNVSTIVRKLLEQDAKDGLPSSADLTELANGKPTSYAQAMVLAMIKKALEGVIVLNGQLDNEIKGSTTTDNMRSLAMQGYWQHGPLLGY